MKKIYVGNLPYSLTADALTNLFSQYGAISEIALIEDRYTGKPKGFGFITFESAEAAQAAIVLDGQEVDGRKIKVSIAREKTEGGPGPRRSGGFRGDRGDRGDRGGFGGNRDRGGRGDRY